jgi:hypothetical protein
MSVTYNKGCLDQSRSPRKAYQIHQSLITPLPYQFPRQLRHPRRTLRQSWESPRSQIPSLRRVTTAPDFIVIDSARVWVLLTRLLSITASIKTAGEKDTGNDGVHTSLIGNGFVASRFHLTAMPSWAHNPPGNRQRRLFRGRRCVGALPP